jgi:hypothetical protein
VARGARIQPGYGLLQRAAGLTRRDRLLRMCSAQVQS